MYDPQLEKLIDMALEDGIITDKEKNILIKRAQSLGIDLDEFEMYLDSRLASLTTTPSTNTSQKKFGDVLKCPSCGASVPLFTVTCKDCGFEFRNIAANSSVKELGEKMENASKTVVNGDKAAGDNKYWLKVDDIKSEIVKNFPIPNTKDDLMEFAIFTSQNITPLSPFDGFSESLKAQDRWNQIWIEKFKQIIFKAKILCKDDPNFTETIFNLVKKRKINVYNKSAIGIACTIAGVSLLLGIILGAKFPPFYFLLLITYTVAPIYYFTNVIKPFDNNWEE